MAIIAYALAMLLAMGLVNSENSTLADSCELELGQPGPFGALLEEWATMDSTHTGRQGRILALPVTKGYYVAERIDGPFAPPPPPPPPGARPPHQYDEWRASPPPPPSPGKIVNRPPNPYKDKFKPSPSYQPQQLMPIPANLPSSPPPSRPYPSDPYKVQNTVDRVDESQQPPRKQVSETDLYLLTAIEKLVYRVDLMEKRLRRVEDSLHELVAVKDNKPELCAAEFIRLGEGCYHFSHESLDWKAASIACRKRKSELLELDDAERRKIVSYVQANKALKDEDWWTGGLNPGLLWIWAGSARPVLGNTTAVNGTQQTNSSSTAIAGAGRCLSLQWAGGVRAHVLRGAECARAQRYVCERDGGGALALANDVHRLARGLRQLLARADSPARDPPPRH